ncbi:uncharacterized protein LOC134210771 [Armigeres subalbatus]|uniref:uncharacterized protein LOC134210771 n=1 Tax=Armigeres subalbatus TaxID=124917 RepID=UPI002ED33ADA
MRSLNIAAGPKPSIQLYTFKTSYHQGSSKRHHLNYGTKNNRASKLHFFGCSANVYVPAEKRTKLDPKGEKLTFVGYVDNHKAVRFIDRTNDKITISRDANFIEMEDHEDIKHSEKLDTEIIEYEPEVVQQINVDFLGDLVDAAPEPEEDMNDDTMVEEKLSNIDSSIHTPTELRRLDDHPVTQKVCRLCVPEKQQEWQES